MTRTLRISEEHLQRFADASGDRNPLHVDESFARQTPYGRCISHGALVTAAALGVADEATLQGVRAIDAQFKQPVFPGEDYTISLVRADTEKTRIEVGRAGRVAAIVTVTSDAAGEPLPEVPEQGTPSHATSPLCQTLEGLADPAVSFSEPYACRLEALSALVADLGAGHVPDAVLVWLAAASYTVGMLVPGRDALLIGTKITRSSLPRSGTLDASVQAVDDRTGLVRVKATLGQDAASAEMTLPSFLRPPVPAPDRSSIGRYMPPSTELSGSNILVVGASRGLGGALCGAFATQGATVWAGFARSAEPAENLRREFGAERIRLLQFDAEDTEQSRRAFDTIRAEAGSLDGVVLCAAPPLYDAALHPDATEAMLRFLGSSIAMTLIPLAEAAQMLEPDGWLVVMSSAALDDPSEGWPHYVVAKGALEGAAAYCARHTPARVLVVRAPRMWTDSTNTPLGRIDAVPKERVAAAIAGWVMKDGEPQQLSLLTAEELLEAG